MTWELAGFSPDSVNSDWSVGFVFYHINSEFKLARAHCQFCHTGPRVWPLLSSRWCTVLSNLFITPRVLLYVSSIFHARGVNHQQHPVSAVMNGWTCCLFVPSSREAAYTEEWEWQWLTIPNMMNVHYTSRSGLSETSWMSFGKFLRTGAASSFWWMKLLPVIIFFFLIPRPGVNTAGFHHRLHTYVCACV